MERVKSKRAMIGCSRQVYRALAIAPGTVVELCAEHYAKEQSDLELSKATWHSEAPGAADLSR